jgi:hypothetical protein
MKLNVATFGRARTIGDGPLEAVADQSLALLKFIDAETTAFVERHGVSMDYVAKLSEKLLEQWHAADAL